MHVDIVFGLARAALALHEQRIDRRIDRDGLALDDLLFLLFHCAGGALALQEQRRRRFRHGDRTRRRSDRFAPDPDILVVRRARAALALQEQEIVSFGICAFVAVPADTVALGAIAPNAISPDSTSRVVRRAREPHGRMGDKSRQRRRTQ